MKGKTFCEVFMNEEARKYLSDIGRNGGQKSRRKLTKAQARAMVAARERKRRKPKRVARRSNDALGVRSPLEFA